MAAMGGEKNLLNSFTWGKGEGGTRHEKLSLDRAEVLLLIL